jgi:hypothetical protein
MNRFAYANGNPISAIDPFGTMAQDAAQNGSIWNGVWQAAVGGLQDIADKVGTAAGLIAYNNVAGDVKLGFGAGYGGYLDFSQNGEGGYGVDVGFGNAFGGIISATLNTDIPSALKPAPEGYGASFGYSFTASGKLGTFEADAELSGNDTFSSNGNYQLNPVAGGFSIGPPGGTVGPQVNGNLFNASEVNGNPLQGQATIGAGTGVFFFAGVHAGVRF